MASCRAHTPTSQECFEVLSGTLGVRVGRRKYKLGAGGVVMVPAGAVHTCWNEGDEILHCMVEFRPALDTESVLETIFGLA